MNNLRITGAERHEILNQIVDAFPEWKRIDNRARGLIGPRNKREVWLEQGAVLSYLASQYNRPNARILEIGACQGYSAALMKLSAPEAEVVTLEPDATKYVKTVRTLKILGISVLKEYSTYFLADCMEDGREFDMIFVDGDHDNVAFDLPYWNLLKQDGLFLHHDFSPEGSKRECLPVWDALNHFSEQLGHQPDVLIQDVSLVGLAGWYRRDLAEVWPPEGTELGEDGYIASISNFIRQENGDGVMVLDAADEPADQDTIDAMRKESGTLPTDGEEEHDD